MNYAKYQNIWNMPDDQYGKNAILLHAILPVHKVYLSNRLLSEADELFRISSLLEDKQSDPRENIQLKWFDNFGLHSWKNETGCHNAYLLVIYHKSRYNDPTQTTNIKAAIRELNSFADEHQLEHIYLTKLYDPYTEKTNTYECIKRRWNKISHYYEDFLDNRFTMVNYPE